MTNFYQLFLAAAARVPTSRAVEVQRRDRVDSFDFATLEGMAERVGAGLGQLGVGPSDRCAILADNDERWCAAYLGVMRIGAASVPLDTSYGPGQIRTILEDCGALVAFVSPRCLQPMREACAAMAVPPRLVLLSGAGAGVLGLEPMLEAPRPHGLAPCPARPDDTAVILYTSGTTSDPKGVVLSHGNLMAERDAALQVVDLSERDSILGVLPLFHALAQIANLLLPLSVGARVVFLETLNTAEILRGLSERDVTAFCCVPQFYYLIHQRVTERIAASPWPARVLARGLMRLNGWLRQWLRLNLGRLLFRAVHRALGRNMRILVSGGSRLDPGIGRSLYRLGFNLLQAYGLTECSGAATITPMGDPHVDSVGPAMSGVEIRIAPSEESGGGGDNADGEVLIRGPIVMKGYHNRPDANAAALDDGWLRSGDLGYLDKDGRLFITGRKKEVIVLASGKNIYPEEIEAYYAHSPFIGEICVLGVSRDGDPASERLHAIVVPNDTLLRERKIVNARDLLRFEIEGVSIRLPAHKRVLSFEVWQQELPRTTTRKLKRFEIERLYRARSRHELDGTPTEALTEEEQIWVSDPAVARALAIVAQACKPGMAVVPRANLDLDLGLDSMERVELLATLEQQFGMSVPAESAQRILTVRDLLDAVIPKDRPERRASAGAADPWEQILAQNPDDPLLRGLLERRPVFYPLAWTVMKILRIAAWLLIGLRGSGRQHIPRDGSYLISPNHQSYLDAFAMVSMLPFRTFRQLFFVGATEYFETPLMRWLAHFLNVVPVDPDANLVRAMQAGASGLRHGKILVLFPEGERSPDGTVRRFKKGAAILSAQLGVPIVPVAIEGVYEVWPRNQRPDWRALCRPWRTRARVCFGPPVDPKPREDQAPADRYEGLTEELRSSVEAMWLELRNKRLARVAANAG